MNTIKHPRVVFKYNKKSHCFEVRHLILNHSDGQLHYYYVHQPNHPEKLKSYLLSKKIEGLEPLLDQRFFVIRHGWKFNLKYYQSLDNLDRTIETTLGPNVHPMPPIIVAREKVKGLLAAIGIT